MLDYFLTKGWVKMKEDGSIEKTDSFPPNVKMTEDENGVVKFFFDYGTALIPIQDTPDHLN